MHNRILTRLAAMATIAGLSMFAGCKKQHTDEHDHQGHEGHEHAAAAGEEEGDFCGSHGVPEAECGICQPQLVAELKPGGGLKVRLPAAQSATMEGVTVGVAEKGGLSEGIQCIAEMSFDQNRLSEVSAPVGGIIKAINVDLGSRVTEQQVIAKIWSATIAEAVAKAVLTHQTLDRERKLRAERVTSERDLQQAEAEHRAACQQARTLGFSEDQIDSFGANPDDPVMLEVRAPFAGEIVERWAVQGALVESGRPLFKVADRSTMWAMLSIPESAIGQVREGQEVELRIDSLPGERIMGKLTWVDAKVDSRTRMALARAEVPNPRGVLRANMFASARIITREPGETLLVPESAVQTIEGRPMLFVKLADDLFEARMIRAGTRSGGKLEVLEGIEAGDQLVLANAYPLKSQLLISRLGAGCAHE